MSSKQIKQALLSKPNKCIFCHNTCHDKDVRASFVYSLIALNDSVRTSMLKWVMLE